MVNVRISASKEAQAERKGSSFFFSQAQSFPLEPHQVQKLERASRPGEPKKIGERSVAPLTLAPPRKSQRSEKRRGGISSLRQSSRWPVNPEGAKRVTIGLNKGGHGGVEHVKNLARGGSRDNGGTVWNGTTGLSLVKPTVGQTHSYPVCAVSNPAVSPILAQRVVVLTLSEVAPGTWSGWGLPFEGLTSRRGVDAPVGTMGCHRAGTVSYKRTSPFKCEERIREQLRGTRRVSPPRTNISPAALVKEVSWESQDVNLFRASGPADSCSLLNSSRVRHMIGLLVWVEMIDRAFLF
ncbi:hypothetical protein L873DRAFT_1479649 [Choiromyces venosus 120613-1]|uniref:Uncharacterized protein n=1 Tax=Choiromyces venosus 120613-1 TaxID=1336337 RepID=A0A3N4JC94_9PEZI|nr:hypothetical protein L873DRAFT_1479649 [Choiromyces venosus 120613-1]